MVSRILEHLNAKPVRRKALLVLDGMSYWQWNILGKSLSDSGLSYSSNATLAFIPTITAWSRQAIFKGDKPNLNEDNSKEGKLFEAFWINHGIPPYQITYRKIGFKEPLDVKGISDDIAILGLIVNDLDDLLHGTVMGDEQLKSSTHQWIEKSGIVKTISDLCANGFQLFLTSDHGNIEAKGLKNLSMKDKIGALSRGKRHLQFANETLLQSFLDQNPDLVLGRKNLSVYLKHQEAFTTGNSQVITHGGSHFWEVIVPFISINEQQ